LLSVDFRLYGADFYVHKKITRFLFLPNLRLGGVHCAKIPISTIVPAESALRLESRSLGDAVLRAFMEENVGHLVAPWPPSTLDLGTLSIAALYFNPIRYKETSSKKKPK
jgi:hypothetical protein